MYKSLYAQLPPEFQKIAEFKAITETEFTELEKIEKGSKRVLNENFIDTASEWGIKKYEEQFKIRADLKNESLDFRKLRLKNRKMDRVPFTYRFLENKLINLFGKDNFILRLENEIYTLFIEIQSFDWNNFYEIIDNFREIIPCNIVLNSKLVQELQGNIYYGSYMSSGETITVYPWQSTEIETKANVDIGLANNISFERISVYPKKED